jgi:hypothetical protein
MAQIRHQIQDDQSRHGTAPSEFAPLIAETISATLAAIATGTPRTSAPRPSTLATHLHKRFWIDADVACGCFGRPIFQSSNRRSSSW